MRILAPAAAVVLLAACAPDTASTGAVGTADPAPATTGADPAVAAGPTFQQALVEAYGAMAEFESRAGSAEDASYFRSRQEQAAGTPPAPEPGPTETLQSARTDLMAALGYRDTFPVEVATAQAAYDCWANDARAAAEPVPIDCPRLFRDTIADIEAAR